MSKSDTTISSQWRARLGPAIAAAAAAGAAVMMVEIAAGRLIARYLGQSLYTWTSVIGVVLGGISLGNFVGGIAADRFPPRRLAAALFGLGAIGCWTIPLLNRWVGQWAWVSECSWPLRIFLHTLFCFSIPSALLGSIGPVVAKWALLSSQCAGRTLGAVYAAGALGSIGGTFLAGYWLIPVLGTTRLIFSIGLLLGVVAILLMVGTKGRAMAILVWLCVLTVGFLPAEGTRYVATRLGWRDVWEPGVIYQKESPYQTIRVRVMDSEGQHRALYLDKMLHSEVNLKEPDKLLYRYAWVYEAIMDRLKPRPLPVNALVIGGGGYTFPMYLVHVRPGAQVYVAEIDPEVTQAAEQYFGYVPNPNIRVFHMDARNLIGQWKNNPPVAFDLILGDTFNDYAVPFHLTTVEFTRQLRACLTPDGVYMLNMIDRFDSGRFLSAVVRTFREVFPEVKVIYCHANLFSRGTYVVVGALRALDLSNLDKDIRARHPTFRGKVLDDALVEELLGRVKPRLLTDDDAPVENLLAPVIAVERAEGVELRWLRRGLSAAERGDLDDAIRCFRRATRLNEKNSDAWYNLGVALMSLGNMADALACFTAAVDLDPLRVDARNNIAVILAQGGLLEAALDELYELLRVAPESAVAHNNVGELLVALGREKEAVVHFRKAIELDPAFERARAYLQHLEAADAPRTPGR